MEQEEAMFSVLSREMDSWVVRGSLVKETQKKREEQALIESVRGGERWAFRRLFQMYKDRVYRLCLRLCGDEADAADLLQDVFLRVHRGIHTFRGDAAFSTWLIRLAVNTTRSFLSRQGRRKTISLQEEEGTQQKEPSHTTAPRDPWMRKRLLEALEQLPQKYREVLVLHDIEELTHVEIAEILGIQKGTSKSQLHKARKKMRGLLQEARP